MEIMNRSKESVAAEEIAKSGVSRRKFLQFSGMLGVSVVAIGSMSGLTGCKKDDDDDNNSVNLGSGDIGILNYAYALEQLEAAFYTQVIAAAAFNTTFSSALERSILTDIRDHEVAHREFFKAAITAAAPNEIIPGLTPDFSSVNFN